MRFAAFTRILRAPRSESICRIPVSAMVRGDPRDQPERLHDGPEWMVQRSGRFVRTSEAQPKRGRSMGYPLRPLKKFLIPFLHSRGPV